MPTKKAETSGGFSAEEIAAMKERAAELRAEGRKGATKADGLAALLEAIEKLDGLDRELAERLHVTVTKAAPGLNPKTWYGFPSYANDAGKVVAFFKPASKFKDRYATLGFETSAALDDGDMWPVAFALVNWTPAVEKKIAALIRKA
ncbi:hypothetical protein ACIB24_22835, partial [Spongisporangium articulatum]